MTEGKDKIFMMPFVFTDEARMRSLYPYAESIAKREKKAVKLIKFTHRQEIEELDYE